MEIPMKRKYDIYNRPRQNKGTRIKKISMFIDAHDRVKSVCVYTDYSTISREFDTPEGVNYILGKQAVQQFIRDMNCRTLNYYRGDTRKFTCKYYSPIEFNVERNVVY